MATPVPQTAVYYRMPPLGSDKLSRKGTFYVMSGSICKHNECMPAKHRAFVATVWWGHDSSLVDRTYSERETSEAFSLLCLREDGFRTRSNSANDGRAAEDQKKS